MKVFSSIQQWGDHHHPKWLDFFRVLLGITLIWKGLAFTSTLTAFTTLIQGDIGATATASLIAHLIIVAHILGGFLIALGSNTRVCCLFNLAPPLLALLFTNLRLTIFTPYSDSVISLLVLAGLICFIIEGDGIWTLDYKKGTKAPADIL